MPQEKGININNFSGLSGNVIEFFSCRPRGGDNFTSLFQTLHTLYSKRQKHPFSPSDPVGGTPSSTAWEWVGVKFSYVLRFSWGEGNGNTETKFPGNLRKRLGQSQENPGTIPWKFCLCSMPDMTGRPGRRTMEMFGGSTASYLACTPRIPLFVLIFVGLETKNVLDYQGRAGALPLHSGPFARSYSVSICVFLFIGFFLSLYSVCSQVWESLFAIFGSVFAILFEAFW